MAKDYFLSTLNNQVRKYTGRLDKRQRILLICFILTILASLFFNKILKPRLNEVRRIKGELAQLDRKILGIKAQIPPIEKEKIKLDEAKTQNKRLQEKLKALEKELPEAYQVSWLLGEMARQAGDSRVDFSYIKPKSLAKSEESEEYSQLDIEMQFNVPYYDFKDYLSRLEHVSVFLNVTDIVVEELKEASQGDVTVTMVLSTLLNRQKSEAATLTSEQKKLTFQEEAEERLPFLPAGPEAGKYLANKKFLLAGITYAGYNSTVIINNQMYKMGDTLNKEWLIKKILPNMVIITRGRQAETLTLNKEERLDVKK